MTVGDLIDDLNKFDRDVEVICAHQKDSEGNSYSPLEGVDGLCKYNPHNAWTGQVMTQEDIDYLIQDCDESPERFSSMYDVVVLYPIL